MATKTPTKYEQRTLEMIDDLAEFAMAWGWERDQGSNDEKIEEARTNYEASVSALIKRVGQLHSIRRKTLTKD